MNQLDGFLAHALYFGAVAGFVFFGALEDGVVSPVSGHLPIRLNELPSQVVQCRSQVVQDVADDEGEIEGNRAFELEVKEQVASLRVMLFADKIRATIVEGGDPALKIADVFFGPFDFRPDTD